MGDDYRTGNTVLVDGKASWESAGNTDWNAVFQNVSQQRKCCDLLIVEGFLLYHGNAELLETFNACLYIDCTIDLCKKRRRAKPRGWASVEEYVERCVWPCHLEHQALIPVQSARHKLVKLDASSDVRSRISLALGLVQDMMT